MVSNYIAGKHNTFAYKLEGYNDSWYSQDNINLVSYSNLPAGDYTFFLKAANNDGNGVKSLQFFIYGYFRFGIVLGGLFLFSLFCARGYCWCLALLLVAQEYAG